MNTQDCSYFLTRKSCQSHILNPKKPGVPHVCGWRGQTSAYQIYAVNFIFYLRMDSLFMIHLPWKDDAARSNEILEKSLPNVRIQIFEKWECEKNFFCVYLSQYRRNGGSTTLKFFSWTKWLTRTLPFFLVCL